MAQGRVTGWVLYAAAWLGYVAVLYEGVLSGTRHTAAATYNLTPFASISDTLSSPLSTSGRVFILGGNLLLLVPLAVLVALVVRRRHVIAKIALTAFLASLAIEVTQFLLPSGRSADVDDVILNTGGALLAAMIIVRVAPRTVGWFRRDRTPVPEGPPAGQPHCVV